MKTSLFSSILCASLLVFAVGCGKENKSGGSNNNRYFGNLSLSGLNTTSQQAVSRLTNWYNNRIEGTAFQGVLVKKQTYEIQNTAAQPNCEEKEFLGIPFTYCISTSTSMGGGTLVSEVQINLNDHYNQIINQKPNPELQALFNGTNGQLLGATQSGTVYRLDFFKNNIVTSYVVDTKYHSALNPVSKIEQSQTGAKETIIRAIRLY